MEINDLPTYVQNDFPFFCGFLVIEYIILALKGKPKPRFNDTFTSLSLGLMQECFRIVMRGTNMALYCYINEHYRLITLPETLFSALVVALMVDFAYYWIHRASHEVNILWSHHQVHHSADDFNLSVGVRHGSLNNLLLGIMYSPLAFVASPTQYMVHQHINFLYQFWIHTEAIGNLGPLEWILNTPEHHQVHHGCKKYQLDKNYGGALIIWDRMFGTYQKRKNEKTVYNLVFPPNTFNLVTLQTFYYAPLWNRLKSFDNWTNRIEVLIKGPSWEPGSPWTGWEHFKISISDREKFETLIPHWQKHYIAIHFFLLAAAFFSRFSDAYENQLDSSVYLSYTVASLIILSCILNGRPSWICLMELVRCIFFLVTSSKFFFASESNDYFKFFQMIVFFISTFVWSLFTCICLSK